MCNKEHPYPMPESDYETPTGRRLYTISAVRNAYDTGFNHGFSKGSGSQGYGVCVDGVHIPDNVVKNAVFLYMLKKGLHFDVLI